MPQSTAPATKPALQGPQSTAPITKSARQGPQKTGAGRKFALQGPQSTGPSTKSALQGPQNTLPKYCICYEICTSRSTKYCTCHKMYTQGPQSTAPATISENGPHVQKSRFTTHRHVQSIAPATKSAHQHQTAPISCTCQKKSTLDHQNTRFPLRLARKVITKSKNAHLATTRAHPQGQEKGVAQHRFCVYCLRK